MNGGIVHLKFPGRGQRNTPVADARGIVEVIMLLPGASNLRIEFLVWGSRGQKRRRGCILGPQPGGDPRMAQKVVRCKEAATLKVDVEGALFVF